MIIQVRDRSIKTYASTEHCCICNSVALVKTSSVLCEVNILFDTCGVRNGGVRMENFKNFCQVKKKFCSVCCAGCCINFLFYKCCMTVAWELIKSFKPFDEQKKVVNIVFKFIVK